MRMFILAALLPWLVVFNGAQGAPRRQNLQQDGDAYLNWTPDMIRATARLMQLQNRLPEDDTRALVAEGEAAGQTVGLVEIDPREGSGVIPNDWQAFLQPKRQPSVDGRAKIGVNSPSLRDAKALIVWPAPMSAGRSTSQSIPRTPRHTRREAPSTSLSSRAQTDRPVDRVRCAADRKQGSAQTPRT